MSMDFLWFLNFFSNQILINYGITNDTVITSVTLPYAYTNLDYGVWCTASKTAGNIQHSLFVTKNKTLTGWDCYSSCWINSWRTQNSWQHLTSWISFGY